MAPDILSHRFLGVIRQPFKFRLFLFAKLPAAFFSGIKVLAIDAENCSVSVPFKWLTQNPFRSTYFASLAMAAEMSTGALAMMYVYKRKPAISMLITSMHANYFKKATGTIIFRCEEGKQISDAVSETLLGNEAKNIPVKSTGRNKENDVVAEFIFVWSFKVKANR